ncbi:MAG: phosphoadenosine phosphosulfate reductase family protein [Chloroflexi bacterium]|nr:phosphoadenosine phosphosulfate reductase family protein [Chloroflexota bacterium]
MSGEGHGLAVHHILSFGGGVNSVALMILLLRERLPLDGAVFADTGGELPETYAYLEIARDYLRSRGVPFTVVSKRGRTLYETAWERRVFPSAIWRWSTRDFKVTPILRHYRSLGGHMNQYLAIAWDEIERMKSSRVDYVTNLFPLVDRRMTRADCEALIQDAGLPIPPRSACCFCPFNSVERWRWLYENHPDLYHRAIALEEHSKHFPSQRLTDQAFRDRAEISLRALAEIFRKGEELPGRPAAEQQTCGAECMT